MPKFSSVGCIVAACSLMSADASLAHAHFHLLKPTSWVTEDNLGGPQKGFPCGPGGSDNVNPTPSDGTVTEFHAGDTIDVQWVDTIAHPGHFRIALAANRDDLKPPTITQDASCNYDETMVPTGAHDNVLADGVSFRSRVGFSASAGTMFSQKITLPNTPCDKCTLQVMQIMENDVKAISNCYYNHCADIKILPAVSGGAGAGDAAGMSGAAGTSSASGGAGETDNSSGSSGTTAASSGEGGVSGTSAATGGAGVASSSRAGSSASGGTGQAPGGNSSASAGTGAVSMTPAAGGVAPSTPTTSNTKSGCSVVQPGRAHAGTAVFLLLLGSLLFGRRRARALKVVAASKSARLNGDWRNETVL